MKIKDLPSDIKQLALANQAAQGNKPDDEIDLLCRVGQGGFMWDKSKEGSDYWDEVFSRADKELSKNKISHIPDKIYVQLGIAKSGNNELNALILEAEERELIKRSLIAGVRPEVILRKFRDYYGIPTDQQKKEV
jgi:hypothetical protein